ncbi:flavin reductase family protein [Pseudomonas sp. Z1-14]|uniref:flavin reductase family protein n=1 Tax=Pseudomonas sp. Z1-14 TaxID=2817409 RepID=UPI003DA91C62
MSNGLEIRKNAEDNVFDPRVFRNTLGLYASGIVVISAFDGINDAMGFTCQSFYSVSIDPPLVSFSVMRNSSTYPRIRDLGKFSINVLADSQTSISNQFASKCPDRWAGIDWSLTQNDNPVIAGTLMWLDCELYAEHEAGDHYIVVGRVTQISPPDWSENEPLLYYKGKYRHLSEQLSL